MASIKKAGLKKVASEVSQKVTKVVKKVTQKVEKAANSPEKKKAAATKKKAAVPQSSANRKTSLPTKSASSKKVAKSVVKTPVKAAAKKGAKPQSKESSKKLADHSFSPEYLVLMQKDPNWMQAFWHVSEKRVETATRGGKKLVLRLYDASKDLTVRHKKQKRSFRDLEVPPDARSWYVENEAHGQAVQVVLGTVNDQGVFQAMLEPTQDHIVGNAHPNLQDTDPYFIQASLGGGAMNSGSNFMDTANSGENQWLNVLLSGSGSSETSWSISSAEYSSNAPQAIHWGELGKDFFLWVKTRLIVYGGTKPDAHLQVRGEPFPLNPDGTFSLEMDLPDSTQIIPVFATDYEGDFPTTITPVVIKRTE